jgi:hypothetical protein
MTAAVTQVQRATATYEKMAFDFGPPPIIKPPQELFGELLLKDGKPQKAREASLKRAPNRTQDSTGDKAGATTPIDSSSRYGRTPTLAIRMSQRHGATWLPRAAASKVSLSLKESK